MSDFFGAMLKPDAGCEFCLDEDGVQIYPYYGVAPHVHKGGIWIGSTKVVPKSEWPENFVEDKECPGCGTYTHCLNCGAGDKAEDL